MTARAALRRRALAAVAVAAALAAGLVVGRYGAGDAADEAAPARPSAADIGFSQDMAVHHAQAIRMADVVRGRVGPEVDALAAQVFEAQVHESGVLRGWLQLWDAPQLPSGPPMVWMASREGGDKASHEGHGNDEALGMVGMAPQEEVNRLDELSGTELEVWFLQLMVRHHQGGVVMARAAADLAEVPVVRSLARTMALEQQNEVSLMLQLLGARDGEPLPST